MPGMPEEARQEQQSAELEGASTPAEELPVLVFEALAHGGKEVLINHNSQVYRLRATKNGKLILNK